MITKLNHYKLFARITAGVSLLQALQDIQTIVQQTAEAIAAALQIEVEIADSKMLSPVGPRSKSPTGSEFYPSPCGFDSTFSSHRSWPNRVSSKGCRLSETRICFW